MAKTEEQVRASRLLALVQEAGDFFSRCALAGVDMTVLRQAIRKIAEGMEELPLVEDDFARKPILFFFLSAGKWCPCHRGYVTDKGWLNWQVDYASPSRGSDTGVTRPYHWAHCTADDTPNYHWFNEDDDSPTSKE